MILFLYLDFRSTQREVIDDLMFGMSINIYTVYDYEIRYAEMDDINPLQVQEKTTFSVIYRQLLQIEPRLNRPRTRTQHTTKY